VLLALIPIGLRLLKGVRLYPFYILDILVLVFLITAGVGYWAAYDKVEASSKFWLIVASALFYLTLRNQPKKSWTWLTFFWFFVGVGITGYFLLTHDFVAQPAKLASVNNIGLLLMKHRPELGLPSVHPNDTSGIGIITSLFGVYLLNKVRYSPFYLSLILTGYVIIFFAILLGTSRGAWIAFIGSIGVWLLHKYLNSFTSYSNGKYLFLYPGLVLGLLFVGALLLVIMPLGSFDLGLYGSQYGTGGRIELLHRTMLILNDFPITGGGLGSFPGLYSQYILSIPFYYILNSHNMFVDVAVEQGMLAGLVFMSIYALGIWQISFLIGRKQSRENYIMGLIVLMGLIVAVLHGMVDDYLYGGRGTILTFAFIGMSANVYQINSHEMKVKGQISSIRYNRIQRLSLIIGIFLLLFSLVNLNKLRSVWYANLGSVKMAQSELADFPKDEWIEPDVLSELETAESAFHTALQFDPSNGTANYHLGLIFMLRSDFDSAAEHLEAAYHKNLNHRGVIKSLGYCYVWMSDMEKSKILLSQIPEAVYELDAYQWWWNVHGRSDLAENASFALDLLKSTTFLP